MDKMIQISVKDLKKQLDLGYSIVCRGGGRDAFDMVYNAVQTMCIMEFFPGDILDYADDVYDKVWQCILDREEHLMVALNRESEVMDNE